MEAAVSGEESVELTRPSGRCAYLILCHKNTSQVEELAGRILRLSPTAHVVIHHDLEGGPPPWQGHPPVRVHLVDRTPVEWGGWSIVEATLRMIRFAREDLDSEWLVVVSGEHWPVVDLATWETDVAMSGNDAVMPADALPARAHFGRSDPDGNRDLARCLLRWYRLRRPRWEPAHRTMAALSKLGKLMHPLFSLEFSLRNDSWFVGVHRRRGPVAGWRLYKGSEWFACNARSADQLLRADPAVASWFQRSHIPDESYFQSLLHREARLTVHHAVVTWVPPEPTTPTPGWMLLKPHELPLVAASGAVFARKVDQDRNPEVIAAIDARVDAARQAKVRS